MSEVPEIPITSVPDPTSDDLTDEENEYPLLDPIQGPPSADSVGPEAGNKQPRALDTRTETLRAAVNSLIEVVNSLNENFLHRDGASATVDGDPSPSFMRGNLDMQDASLTTPVKYNVTNLADGVANADAATMQQLDAVQTFLNDLQTDLNGCLRTDGANGMQADLDLGGFKLVNVANPINVNDAVNKSYADTQIGAVGAAAVKRDGSEPMIANLDLGGFKIINMNLADPASPGDGVSRGYLLQVLSEIAAPPTGALVPFAGSEGNLPTGWLLCVTEDTLVTLADGAERTIGEIVDKQQDVEVLGVDARGRLARGRVSAWFDTPATRDDWLRLYVNLGKGSGPRTVTVTKNHPVLTAEEGWVRADRLDPRRHRIVRRARTLTDVGRAALIGRFLGDSHLERGGRLVMSQSESHGEYQRFCNERLEVRDGGGTYASPYAACGTTTRVDGKVSLRTFDPELLSLLRRGVTTELLDRMGPIGLAFWYMDDGSLSSDNRSAWRALRFHAYSESDEELATIRTWLESRFGATSYLSAHAATDGYTLCLSAEGTRRVARAIAPYVHPSMRYKLPENVRNMPFVLAATRFVDWGTIPLPFRVRAVSDLSPGKRCQRRYRRRLDITVEGVHSFVANGFVVHNCAGQTVSQTTFANLFAVLGTTFNTGGEPGGEFRLPDLRGRVAMGRDDMGTTPANVVTDPQADVLGGTLGSEDHVLDVNELPAHAHGFDDQYVAVTTGGAETGPSAVNGTSDFVTTANTTDTTGGGAAHNNVQPTIAMNYIIKT